MLGFEVLVIAGGAAVSASLLPFLHTKKVKERREASLERLKRWKGEGRIKPALFDFKKGSLKDAPSDELAKMEMRLLKRALKQVHGRKIWHFWKVLHLWEAEDSELDRYLASINSDDIPTSQELANHFWYRILHFEGTIPRDVFRRLTGDPRGLSKIESIECNDLRLESALRETEFKTREYANFGSEEIGTYLELKCLKELLEIIENPYPGKYYDNVEKMVGCTIDGLYAHFCWRVLDWTSNDHEGIQTIVSRDQLAGILTDELQLAKRINIFKKGYPWDQVASPEFLFTTLWKARKDLQNILDLYNRRTECYSGTDFACNIQEGTDLHGNDTKWHGNTGGDDKHQRECQSLKYLLDKYQSYNSNLTSEESTTVTFVPCHENSLESLSLHFKWRVVFWNNEYCTEQSLRDKLEEIITREGLATFLCKFFPQDDTTLSETSSPKEAYKISDEVNSEVTTIPVHYDESLSETSLRDRKCEELVNQLRLGFRTNIPPASNPSIHIGGDCRVSVKNVPEGDIIGQKEALAALAAHPVHSSSPSSPVDFDSTGNLSAVSQSYNDSGDPFPEYNESSLDNNQRGEVELNTPDHMNERTA